MTMQRPTCILNRTSVRSAQHRSGISATEVVALIAVFALLGMLVIPALLRLREAARTQTCQENLRALMLGMHAYHDTYAQLPPAAVWSTEATQSLALHRAKRIERITHENWAQLLLPFIGQSSLSNQFDADFAIGTLQNHRGRTTALEAMTCPSDDFNRPGNPYRIQLGSSNDASVAFARGNYAINAGSQNLDFHPPSTAYPRGDSPHLVMQENPRHFALWGNGIAGINKSFSSDEFSNGQSTLVALEEIRAGIHPLDPRGVWALGQIGGSITWAHGVNGDAYGPNNQWERSDDLLGCGRLHDAVGTESLQRERMPCVHYVDANQQATSRSLHAHGVHTAFLDGSVRFISDEVNPGLWHVMHSRETPSEVLAERLDALLEVENLREPPRNDSSRQLCEPSEPTLTNSLGMEFVLVPAGDFTMATPDEGNSHDVPAECPPHEVRITRPYYLGRYEVTQAEYEQVMGENPSCHSSADGGDGAVAGVETGRFPVEQLTWHEAVTFCRRLSELPEERGAGHVYRLPTEAEWEYACRSGKSVAYRWSPQRAPGDDSGETAGLLPPLPIGPVGSYRPNGFGLYDMRGNAWEWCADWFDRGYYARSAVEDPRGPAEGLLKVVRGGDWRFLGEPCKIDYPMMPPWKSSRFVGFRVVCELAAN